MMSRRLLAGGQESRGWAVSRVSVTHWGYCSLLTASGHPAGNRAPFDGFKQCLMTRTHLIRLTRLQKCGIKGQKQGRRQGEKGKDPQATNTRIDCKKKSQTQQMTCKQAQKGPIDFQLTAMFLSFNLQSAHIHLQNKGQDLSQSVQYDMISLSCLIKLYKANLVDHNGPSLGVRQVNVHKKIK